MRSGFGQCILLPCLILDSHSDSLFRPGSEWRDRRHGLTGSGWKPFQIPGKVGPEGCEASWGCTGPESKDHWEPTGRSVSSLLEDDLLASGCAVCRLWTGAQHWTRTIICSQSLIWNYVQEVNSYNSISEKLWCLFIRYHWCARPAWPLLPGNESCGNISTVMPLLSFEFKCVRSVKYLIWMGICGAWKWVLMKRAREKVLCQRLYKLRPWNNIGCIPKHLEEGSLGL